MTPYHRIRLRDGTHRTLRPGELMPEGAVLFSSFVLKDHLDHHDHDPDEDRDRDKSDADRAYEKMKTDISQAWQRPGQEQDNPPATAATPDEARARMIARLSEAYKVVPR